MQKVTQKNVGVRKEEVGTGREIPGDMLARMVSRCASEVMINTGEEKRGHPTKKTRGRGRAFSQSHRREAKAGRYGLTETAKLKGWRNINSFNELARAACPGTVPSTEPGTQQALNKS